MRRGAFDIEFDFSELNKLSGRLSTLNGEQLRASSVEAVNAVITRFDKNQRAAQVADINLPQSYVDSKTTTTLASNGSNPRAEIRTAGDLTIMGRFGPSPILDPERRDRLGRRMGRRSAGVSVPIKPSAPANEPQWFLMRLLNGNGEGVFVRTAAGKAKHLYGPSPYSLFRHQALIGEPALLDDLERTAVSFMADSVEKVFR